MTTRPTSRATAQTAADILAAERQQTERHNAERAALERGRYEAQLECDRLRHSERIQGEQTSRVITRTLTFSALAAFVSIVASLTAYNVSVSLSNNRALVDMVKAGSPALAASCALGMRGNEPVCVLMARGVQK